MITNAMRLETATSRIREALVSKRVFIDHLHASLYYHSQIRRVLLKSTVRT
jgi:hypothetical protein